MDQFQKLVRELSMWLQTLYSTTNQLEIELRTILPSINQQDQPIVKTIIADCDSLGDALKGEIRALRTITTSPPNFLTALIDLLHRAVVSPSSSSQKTQFIQNLHEQLDKYQKIIKKTEYQADILNKTRDYILSLIRETLNIKQLESKYIPLVKVLMRETNDQAIVNPIEYVSDLKKALEPVVEHQQISKYGLLLTEKIFTNQINDPTKNLQDKQYYQERWDNIKQILQPTTSASLATALIKTSTLIEILAHFTRIAQVAQQDEQKNVDSQSFQSSEQQINKIIHKVTPILERFYKVFENKYFMTEVDKLAADANKNQLKTMQYGIPIKDLAKKYQNLIYAMTDVTQLHNIPALLRQLIEDCSSYSSKDTNTSDE